MFTLIVGVVILGIFSAECKKVPLTDDGLEEAFGSVLYVTIIFRHGDRTPIRSFPSNPIPSSYWKEGAGQLLKVGKLHEYLLGKWFRQRYQNLLYDEAYRYDRVLVNSSDVDRTLMSAELFLAGLYPPDEQEMWNTDNVRWQPVPIHTVPKPMDNIINLQQPCERYELEKELLNNSPEFAAFFDEHRELFDYVSTHSGTKMTQDDVTEAISEFQNIYDNLLIESLNNVSIPEWALKVYPQPMKPLADFFFSTITYTDEMRRLKGGPLLKTIVDDLKAKSAGGLGNQTFHIYSGHDTTIAVLLDTLDVFNRMAPPYCSAVLVELRKKDDDYFVSVLYRNSSLSQPYLLKLRGCESEVCTLDEFVQFSKPKIPDNWEYECELGFLVKLYYFTYFDLFVLGILCFVLVAVIVIIARLHFVRTRRYKHYHTFEDCVVDLEGIKLNG